MKKKQFFASLFLLVCMLFAMSVAASAYKNQWVTTNGSTYYYGSNGKMYTGGPKAIKKNGKTYLYLFDSKGRLVKNQLTYVKSSKKLYLSLSDGHLLTGFGTWKGQTYYGTSKGYLRTGLQKYGGKYYYFNSSNGQAVKRAWKKVGKYYYYFNGKGRAYHGAVYTINGDKYYFDKDAHRVTGVQKVGDYYYCFHIKTGKMVYGWRKYNGQTYYFANNSKMKGRACTNGIYKISGKRYYFNNLGARQTGWIVLGTKRYYFDPKDGGAQVYGKKTINGTTYNFGTKGYVTYTPSGNMTIRVNRAKNVVTIYDGNTPVKAMACSVGLNNATPVGTFYIQSHYRWWTLDGPTTGQYCSHFLSSYLFHSVPMSGTDHNPYNVAASDYNKLGQAASHGCVRLCVADARWIYYNCPIGTKVVISDKEATPLGKPAVVKMKAGTVGKDPTDIWS
ncbi:hypothetical protein BRYFOR_07406 [Marvinbryantia formatexigens DSM 14469]|uniref:L,D-TPase catalytic domain-containing protein n=1 Tax=Marvinbryantia formatexigens DSM 14469 TaxID=478749 RepID=C6LFK4_9FIRM|nr:L,D-transpeptidase [Marvinbryantia formatexigens]EET60588.1 hypothetical protein BRYFOR_07406 [Marvinbryantia formatexigens DSM 14469]UWO25581.1 L,D-transpeptidase family protein [Marvinbryantia formatexigens DSM 14469]SDG18813.1 Glucan-binding domain-containing protein (YG repeat) [Marvinbryantia formatexigens]